MLKHDYLLKFIDMIKREEKYPLLLRIAKTLREKGWTEAKWLEFFEIETNRNSLKDYQSITISNHFRDFEKEFKSVSGENYKNIPVVEI